MNVQVIQPKSVSSNGQPARPAVLRVAAYCRVSTDADEQKSSYEAQCRHYATYIAEHQNWTLAGIFADEGISGTQARRRPEFLRMIEACHNAQVDLVITKSISRFARNTMDCLTYIRELKSLGIPVIFEKESINTMEASGEVLITILASLAQQESASISQNVKMGIRYVMREGRGRVNYTRFLGYTKGPSKGSLVIVPDEAVIIRRIYRAYLEGYSPALICELLQADGVATPSGGTRWHASTVSSILRNEKYCGDLLLQKYFTPDYLTHKVVRNTGQLPKYLVRDHHEPIVPRAVFAQVQGERARRASLCDTPAALRFGSREALRGRVVCGLCGSRLRRQARAGEGDACWLCAAAAGQAPARPGQPFCPLPPQHEYALKDAVLRAINALPAQRAQLLAMAQDLARHAQQAEPHSLARADLLHRQMQARMLLELLDCLREAAAAVPPPAHDLSCPACHDADDFFARTRFEPPAGVIDASGHMARFDDQTIVRYLAQVTVHQKYYEVALKAGLRVRV